MRDVRQDEVDKFTTDDQGRVAVRLEGTSGDNPAGVANMNVLLLQKEAFTLNDLNEVAVRVVGAGGGGNPGAGLVVIPFIATQWVKSTSNTSRSDIQLTHNLNTTDIIADWFDANGNEIDVDWTASGTNELTACIVQGNEFAGVVRIISASAGADYELTFVVSDFIQTTGTDNYVLNVPHNLGTETPGIDVRTSNGAKVIIEPEIISNATIRYTVFANERFDGYIHVRV